MTTTLKAHAKVNLNLRIHRRRDDGFHELSTLMAPIGLADELRIRPAAKFELICTSPGVPTDESNLVTKAVLLLEKEFATPLPYSIELVKHIPHGAGLGGGSSDAAAVLKFINEKQSTPLSLVRLSELAAELGSDVPFFLHGCLCECSGRGEAIIPRPELRPRLPLLLLKPAFGVATPDAYQRWQGSKELPGIPYRPQMIEELELVNDLEVPVFEKHRFLAEMKRWLIEQPETQAAMMSGSGSTTFAVLKHPEGAHSLAARAKAELDPTLWTWSGHTAL